MMCFGFCRYFRFLVKETLLKGRKICCFLRMGILGNCVHDLYNNHVLGVLIMLEAHLRWPHNKTGHNFRTLLKRVDVTCVR